MKFGLIASLASVAFAQLQTFTGSVIDINTQTQTATVRAFTVNDGGDAFSVVGAAVSVDASSATLDAAAFACQTPPRGDSVGFYAAVLSGSAGFDIGTGSVTGSYSGSLAELATGFYSVIPYIEGNSQDGLQYDFDSNNWKTGLIDCDSGVDCILYDDRIEFKDLTWDPITHVEYSCELDPNAVTTNPCRVNTFTLKDTTGYVQFDMHIASQPVLLNGAKVEPDFTKLDVTINFPWGTASGCNDDCSVALVALTAGAAVDATGVFTASDAGSAHSTTFSNGDYQTYFEWVDTAEVTTTSNMNGVTSTVYYHEITGEDLDTAVSAQSSLCLTPNCLVNIAWNAYASAFAAVNWELRLHIFSWSDIQPTRVFWDPQLGSRDCSVVECPTAPSSSAASTLSLF